MARRRPKTCWNVELIMADMALRRWGAVDLAKKSRKDYKTIDRFLAGEVQTTKTAGAIADAFGYSVKRYFSHVEGASGVVRGGNAEREIA